MIKKEEVSYIAKLAKLRFTDEEKDELVKEFEAILGHFHSIDKLDLDAVDLNKYSHDIKPVFREDAVKIYDDKDKLFQNVKSKRETYIQVPKIIE
ncbi:MAG: glutamyl-tRNA amidotransferase [Clostridiaceae bacterium]|jgi:aspartyl-tRNA(Asn)/glutamyl-tRNA(Gln) amidotransferase subunit C|nr:glutamyl-tRNA amidotransferase [Clostridiaceae bacterium]